MNRATSALLWGAVGTLAFLVLAQAAVLASVRLPVGMVGRVGLALAIGGVVAAVAYAAEHRLTRKGQA